MKTKTRPINGWTKSTMIEQVRKYVPKVGKCAIPRLDGQGVSCLYFRSSNEVLGTSEARCAVGAFLDPDTCPNAAGTVGHLLQKHPEIINQMPLASHWLADLQYAHDNCSETDMVQDEVVKWIENNVEDDQ